MIYINTGFYITIFSFFIAMSRWGLLREQLMWHLLRKLLIMFCNVWEAQLLTDGACCSNNFLAWHATHHRLTTQSRFFLGFQWHLKYILFDSCYTYLINTVNDKVFVIFFVLFHKLQLQVKEECVLTQNINLQMNEQITMIF